jgi:hypothetical protein
MKIGFLINALPVIQAVYLVLDQKIQIVFLAQAIDIINLQAVY